MRRVLAAIGLLFILLICFGVLHFVNKYRKSTVMVIPIEEVSGSHYPEDPLERSIYYDSYSDRILKLTQLDDTHFDFTFESVDPSVATLTLKSVDLGLFVPVPPFWTKKDLNTQTVAIIDREWNRQQVNFPIHSSQIEIIGGDGFEQENLYSIELVSNSLNAGLWEVLLFTLESGVKKLYYQGWFTFPLGYYKDVFEKKNDLSYWDFWTKLEQWTDPTGTPVKLETLREVIDEVKIIPIRDHEGKLVATGEQLRKTRLIDAKNVRCFGDFCVSDKPIYYPRFVKPGRYNARYLQKNKLYQLGDIKHVLLKKIRSHPHGKLLDEIELIFQNDEGEKRRYIVSGVNLKELPKVPLNRYSEEVVMPMGIGVPPTIQSYPDLKKNPPFKSSYFSLLLDSTNGWVNYRDFGIEGPIIHRDLEDENMIHFYLLSYERFALVDHYVIPINDSKKVY